MFDCFFFILLTYWPRRITVQFHCFIISSSHCLNHWLAAFVLSPEYSGLRISSCDLKPFNVCTLPGNWPSGMFDLSFRATLIHTTVVFVFQTQSNICLVSLFLSILNRCPKNVSILPSWTPRFSPYSGGLLCCSTVSNQF